MNNVYDFNRIKLDRIIKQWEETGELPYIHNEELREMLWQYVEVSVKVYGGTD